MQRSSLLTRSFRMPLVNSVFFFFNILTTRLSLQACCVRRKGRDVVGAQQGPIHACRECSSHPHPPQRRPAAVTCSKISWGPLSDVIGAANSSAAGGAPQATPVCP
jgi:hypothetical protein